MARGPLYAQGDLLIESITPQDAAIADMIAVPPDADGALVLAHGELTGHRHALCGAAMLYRDDALARDMPIDLYLGYLRIDGVVARLLHDEHAPIELPPGHYRVRRQREYQPPEHYTEPVLVTSHVVAD